MTGCTGGIYDETCHGRSTLASCDVPIFSTALCGQRTCGELSLAMHRVRCFGTRG